MVVLVELCSNGSEKNTMLVLSSILNLQNALYMQTYGEMVSGRIVLELGMT